MSLSEAHRASLAEQGISFIPALGDDGAYVWNRGPVKFAGLDRAVHQAVVGCLTVSDADFDPIQVSTDIHQSIEERIKPPRPSFKLALFWRQVLLGILIVGALVLLTMPFQPLIGDMGVSAIIVMVGVFVIFFFCVYPRIRRRDSMKLLFQQGDENGDIRKALAELGVQLP